MPRFSRACLAVALMFAAIGCGAEDEPPRAPDLGGGGGDETDAGVRACVDEDGDGYGLYCARGTDCDDGDPQTTDECRRCVRPAKGCPCTPGAAQLSCEPPVKHVEGGIFVCAEGTRYCRDGRWGDCETIGDYVFVPDR